ncbi:MAG: ABC transporter ATP-binding protein [Clostridia bacterium]|nr:ABC transporter ATP-binding protein [Clostridia bacterium]
MAKEKKQKKKEKKPKQDKLPMRRVVQNNLYMLKIIHSVDPWLIPLRLFMAALVSTTYFLGSTYLLQYALNAVGEGKGFYDILWMAILFVALELSADLVNNAFWQLYYEKRRYAVGQQVNLKIFAHADKVELACYENPEFYDKFVKALGEADDRAMNVLDNVAGILWCVVDLALCVGLVVSVHPVFLLFALIPLVTIPLRAKYQKGVHDKDMEIRKIDRRKGYPNRVFFVADYAKELRLSAMPTYLLKYMKDASETCRRIHARKGGLLTLLECGCIVFGNVLPTVLTTVYAVWRTVVQGLMGFGDCFVVLNTTMRISGVLLDSLDEFMNFRNNARYIDTMREFLEYRPKITDGDAPLPESGDIALHHVAFQYEGAAAPTLQDISMTFGAGQRIAIVGANGAGKSTLVKLLLRLYDAEGEITYGGVPIQAFDVREWRDTFAAVMQDFHLFAVCAAENVTLSRRAEGDEENIIRALQRAGIWEKLSQNGGLDACMTREFDPAGVMLSGGEAQKLAIAHVYAKQNRFVILDEPSSALDPIAEYEMYRTMLDACAGCGVIFISHRLSSAVLADKIYLIDSGRVAESGTHEQLMAKDGIYADMFRKQAENYRETKSGEVSA